MSIIQNEIDTYEEVHSLENYSKMSPGEKFLPILLEHTSSPSSVLDAGCASGKGGIALSKLGYSVTLGDITDSGLIQEAQTLPFTYLNLWRPIPAQFDYVICCDVLEHIPTQFTLLSIQNMLNAAKSGLFLTVSTQPDWFGSWVGKPLHQTVQPFEWWKDSIAELADIIDARDLIKTAVFFVKRK